MPETLINDNGLIVEYFGAICPEWSPTAAPGDEHFRTECTMTGSNKQLLKQNLPDITPEECPECGSDVEEHYTVITWVPGERVDTDDALELLEGTHGYMVLEFNRKAEPLSDFCGEYFPSDKPLFVYWEDEELTATTPGNESPRMDITVDVLDEFLTHYPVDAVTPDETPFDKDRAW